jgi:hypothetical protein
MGDVPLRVTARAQGRNNARRTPIFPANFFYGVLDHPIHSSTFNGIH